MSYSLETEKAVAVRKAELEAEAAEDKALMLRGLYRNRVTGEVTWLPVVSQVLKEEMVTEAVRVIQRRDVDILG